MFDALAVHDPSDQPGDEVAGRVEADAFDRVERGEVFAHRVFQLCGLSSTALSLPGTSIADAFQQRPEKDRARTDERPTT
jgi:hypothetical protein